MAGSPHSPGHLAARRRAQVTHRGCDKVVARLQKTIQLYIWSTRPACAARRTRRAGRRGSTRRRELGTSVVMLTSFGQHDNVVRALAQGASGFVLKNCTPEELIRAVKAAHEGDAYLSPAVTRLVLGMVTPVEATRRSEAAQRLSALTEREASILRLVAEGNSNAEIGRRLHMSETTIKTYVSRILSKLHCSNRVQAALMVRDAGG